MQELIGSVMVSSLLLPVLGTLSLLLYFQLPSTFLPSKGRSITTLGTRWHDFFLLPFLDILFIRFILFIAFLCLFLRDTDSRKGTLHPFCVPIHLKKKKKKNCHILSGRYLKMFPTRMKFCLPLNGGPGGAIGASIHSPRD